jgi:hypothetical protein
VLLVKLVCNGSWWMLCMSSTKETHLNLVLDQLMRKLERLKGNCIVAEETPYEVVRQITTKIGYF